jgi:hypothetical protein
METASSSFTGAGSSKPSPSWASTRQYPASVRRPYRGGRVDASPTAVQVAQFKSFKSIAAYRRTMETRWAEASPADCWPKLTSPWLLWLTASLWQPSPFRPIKPAHAWISVLETRLERLSKLQELHNRCERHSAVNCCREPRTGWQLGTTGPFRFLLGHSYGATCPSWRGNATNGSDAEKQGEYDFWSRVSSEGRFYERWPKQVENRPYLG